MQKQHVHIIKMGGTIEFIDPAYDDINKKLLKLDSSIESYLNSLIKPHFNFSTETIVQKDSRSITQEDREKLVKAIETTPHKNILITHGTFTMRETAQYINQNSFDDKKVILTYH
jgi:L-asparaginase